MDAVYPRRPHFATADDYIANVFAAHAAGRIEWEPQTRDEFVALANALPQVARWYRPADSFWLTYTGLPTNYAQPVEPFGQEWRDKFLATLAENQTFCMAVTYLLSGEAS